MIAAGLVGRAAAGGRRLNRCRVVQKKAAGM